MSDERCENCRFWKLAYREPGVCHRFPHTEEKHSSDWCGEHKPIASQIVGYARVVPSSSSPRDVNAEMQTALAIIATWPISHPNVNVDASNMAEVARAALRKLTEDHHD